jgi:hypothetical protein
LALHPGISVYQTDDLEFGISVGDEKFRVILDDADVEEEERGQGSRLGKRKAPEKVATAADVLDVCLAALADSSLADHITDLTTDGGSDDCEAIFTVGKTDFVLKVR